MLGSSFDYAFLPTFGTRGGILVAWRFGIWAASHVRHANNTLSLFISLVAPPPNGILQWSTTTTRSVAFLQEICNICAGRSDPWLICGDFN
jgi:hypothetical protein